MATQQSELNVLVSGKDDLSPQLNQIESKLIRFVGAIGASLAAIRIGGAPIKAAAEFERELANVKKTTDFLPASMRQLEAGLLAMSTQVNVSAKDLAKISAEAGQQGLGRYGVQGVLQFTDSVARMASVLDVSVETAANDVGKIVNIFKLPLSEIERAVSQFNETANNSTAKGGELLDVVKRLGDAAGTLKLGDSIALAATGLDFGASPEVVGTAYTKMFSSMTQKSAEFGRMIEKTLKKSGTEWAKGLQTDGLAAFKEVLAGLRKLTPQDQQNTVAKLFGTGSRGVAILNKLLQDTTNSVLERNFAAQVEGQKGTSALKEQANVLNTLREQAVLTQNALVKASIEATSSVLKPLTSLVIGLREVFESAQFRLILRSIVDDAKSLASAVGSVTGFLGGLNINWGNFLNLARAFIALKLVSFLGGMAGVLTNSALGLKSIASSGAGAVTALKTAQAADSVSGARRAAELVGLQHIYDAIQRNKAAELEAAQIKRDLTLKQNQLDASSLRTTAAASGARTALGSATAASDTARGAKSNVQAAMQAAQEREIATRAARAARIEAAELAHQTRLATITQDYNDRRKAINATGSEAGLKTLRTEKARLIAEEEAFHTRSLRGIEGHWARRMATETAAAKATVDAQRAIQMQALGRLDAAVTNNNTAGNLLGAAQDRENRARAEFNASKNNAAAAAITNGVLAAQSGIMATVRGAWTSAIGVWTVARATIVSVGTAVVGLASTMLSAFAWVTLIYTLADALGLVDKAAPYLQRFTDAIGLTSESSRKAKVAQEEFSETMRQQQIQIDAVTESYRKMAAERGGKIDAAQLKPEVQIATTSLSTDQRSGAVNRIADLAVGASTAAEQARFGLGGEEGIKAQKKIQQEIAETQKKINELSESSRRALGAVPEGSNQFALRQGAFGKSIGENVQKLAELEVQLANLRGTFPTTNAALQEAEGNFATIAGVLASFQTAESAKAIEDFLIPLSKAREELASMNGQLTRVNTDATKGVPGATELVAAFTTKVEEANLKVNGLKLKFLEFLTLKQNDKTLPEAIAKSIQDLPVLQERDTKTLKTVVEAVTKSGVKANGANAGVVLGTGTKGTGDTAFDVKDKKDKAARAAADLARRLRAAQLEFLRAQSEAAANLVAQQNARIQAAEDAAFAKGLIALEKYYEDRAQRQQAGIDNELAQRETDVKNAQAAQKEPGVDVAERKRLDADIVKLRGQIAVLNDRKTQIANESKQATIDAREQFDAQTLQLAGSLAEEGFIPRSGEARFRAKLAGLMQEAQVQFAKLRTEGESVKVGGTPEDIARARERIAAIEATTAALLAQKKAQALDSAFKPLKEASDLTGRGLAGMRKNVGQLNQDGQLTDFQAEQAVDKQIAAAIPVLAQYIKEQEALLLLNKDLEGSAYYQKVQLDIADARAALRDMALETEATARSINQSITGSLTNAIAGFDFTIKGLGKAIKAFLGDAAKSIQAVFAKDIAQSWMQSINSGGAGGVGGLFSNLLGQATGANTPTGKKGNPLYVKIESNAVPKDAAVGIDQTQEDPNAVGTLLWEKFKGGMGELGTSFKSIFEGFGASFDSALGGFGQLFMTGVQYLIGALMTASTATAAAGGASGFIGLLSGASAAVAHTGGVLGYDRLQSRLVAPGVFRNATAYHTGGVLGLKANEVPIIGLKGEEMLTESDPRHRKNLGKTAGGADRTGTDGGGVVNVWVVTQDQMPSAGPSDIVAVVSDNISRGGSIKRLIQQVNIGAV
jgi:TP901 family phage tail tape measure protein